MVYSDGQSLTQLWLAGRLGSITKASNRILCPILLPKDSAEATAAVEVQCVLLQIELRHHSHAQLHNRFHPATLSANSHPDTSIWRSLSQ